MLCKSFKPTEGVFSVFVRNQTPVFAGELKLFWVFLITNKLGFVSKKRQLLGSGCRLVIASARNGNRTRTAITGQGILSPSCLPIPPSGHFAVQFANCGAKILLIIQNSKFKIQNYLLIFEICSEWGNNRTLSRFWATAVFLFLKLLLSIQIFDKIFNFCKNFIIKRNFGKYDFWRKIWKYENYFIILQPDLKNHRFEAFFHFSHPNFSHAPLPFLRSLSVLSPSQDIF